MMFREIVPGVFWIQECGGNMKSIAASLATRPQDWFQVGREIHIPQNAYLFVGERTLLFDTLSPASRTEVVQIVEHILGGRTLDYLVISHPDVPHAGNTMRLLRAFPGVTLVAPKVGDTHALYHLDEAMKVAPGDTIDLGGFTLAFHEATFLDAPISTWMTETTHKMLLPVDWLGFPHMDGECLRFVDELEHDVTIDRLTEFHGRVFFWFQYVNAPKVQREIDRLIARFNPSMIAPAHGLVIRQEPVRYMEMMKAVVAGISRHGRLGIVG